MPSMTKRVNVQTRVAVRNTNPPIYGTYKDIIMTTGDILKCLTKKATVDEILPDGSTIRLNYKNYYTDNGAGLDAAKANEKIIKPKTVAKAAPKTVKKADETPAIQFSEDNVPVQEPTNPVDTATDENTNTIADSLADADIVDKSDEETISVADSVEDVITDSTDVATEAVKADDTEKEDLKENVPAEDAVESADVADVEAAEGAAEEKVSTTKKKTTSTTSKKKK